jgi:hypothetical protein
MPSYAHLRVLMIWLTLDARKCFDLNGIQTTDVVLMQELSHEDETMKLADLLGRLPRETQRIIFNLVSSCGPSGLLELTSSR